MTEGIKGHTTLDPETIERINEIKDLEARWNGLIDRLRSARDTDPRLVAIAATQAEGAFMFAVKAIAQPERLVR